MIPKCASGCGIALDKTDSKPKTFTLTHQKTYTELQGTYKLTLSVEVEHTYGTTHSAVPVDFYVTIACPNIKSVRVSHTPSNMEVYGNGL